MNAYTLTGKPTSGTRPLMHRIPLLLAFLLSLFVLPGIAVPADPPPAAQDNKDADEAPDARSISSELDKIEHSLKSVDQDVEKLDDYLSVLAKSEAWGKQCATDQEAILEKTTEQLAAVGEPVRGEAAEVVKQRAKLAKEKLDFEKTLATCRVIAQRGEKISDTVSAIKKSIHSEELFTRGPGLLVLVVQTVTEPGIWLDATKLFLTDTNGLAQLSQMDVLVFILVTVLMMAIGWTIRRRAVHAINRAGTPETASERFSLSLLITLRRYVIALLVTVATALLFYFHDKDMHPVPFINIVAYGLPLVLVMTATINLFIKPLPHTKPLTGVPESTAIQLSRRIKVLVILIFIGYLLFSTILAQSLPETVFLVARMIYGAFMIINLIWILWLVDSKKKAKQRIALRFVVSTALLTSLVSSIFGYHNLAWYVFGFVVGTLIILGMYFFVSEIIRVQLDALDESRGGWQQKLRNLLGLKPDQAVPGMLWIRLLITITLWVGLFFGLTEVWQVPQSTIDDFTRHITDGFAIGSFNIEPLAILQSILALMLLLTLNTWFKKWLVQEWLERSHMDHGARESVATISGYAGASLAVLVALSIAGMDFSKLAIIAGALSVGIGFGLQNIVSNFISGLILLFERPVRTGDWIIVGEVEGYVKRISIRTTQIMTFDRADVIVPNTELISGNVTNLMLHDLRGRLSVPVGVAYGSDTRKVEALLLEVAHDHPEVMGEGFGVSAPYVLFSQFGDSSLNFELRCFIANIDRRRRVISDINFAIDEAFREHEIEIPFPQRDIHIKQNGADTPVSGTKNQESVDQPENSPDLPDESSAKENDN